MDVGENSARNWVQGGTIILISKYTHLQILTDRHTLTQRKTYTNRKDRDISTFYTIFQYFKNVQDFQENDVITSGKMALFGGTSTQINCFGPMNLCAKFHAFSTICKIFHHLLTLERTSLPSSSGFWTLKSSVSHACSPPSLLDMESPNHTPAVKSTLSSIDGWMMSTPSTYQLAERPSLSWPILWDIIITIWTTFVVVTQPVGWRAKVIINFWAW